MSSACYSTGCFRDQFEKLRHRNSTPDWLRNVREQGFETFCKMGFPSARDEEWRFIDISPVQDIEFKLYSDHNESVDAKDISLGMVDRLDSHLLLFVDGTHKPKLSTNARLPDRVTIDELSSIEQHEALAGDYLGKCINDQNNAFTALNTAFLNHIAVVRIPDNLTLTKPIHLLYVQSGREENTAIYPRNLIVVGDNSEVTIVENYIGSNGGRYFTNTVTELIVGNNSRVQHCKIQRENNETFHFGTMQVIQKQNSDFTSNSITIGGKLNRNNINVTLAEEGSECTLNGLYLGTDQQVIDNHTRIEHAKPNCNSHELYKGILDGRSSAVFNGKIYVHPGAQKTDAKQTNRVLLLSDDAKINTKPELEIYADDVKCTHGATVGQLDEEALFYLRSRGIDHKKAHSILTYAFAGEALEKLDVSAIKTEIDNILVSHFR